MNPYIPQSPLPNTADPAPVSLLAIDDNQSILECIAIALAQPGLKILTASNPEKGLDLFRSRRPEIVLTDLMMPRIGGMEVLERIMEIDPATDVILMTAHYSAESAVEAIKKGASDYLNKPFSLPVLREKVAKLLEDLRRRQRFSGLEDELQTTPAFEGIVGRSPAMREMFSRIRRAAPHYRSLLITGETGTGKDLAARAIHNLSPAASGRYVVLNCSAVVETLLESELFGHVKGAFTGAAHDKPGLFEHAHGGTLFLDEIGDMPLAVQCKLLRVLQDQEVQRVGALNAHKVDVRVIAATNHDLRSAVSGKRFREDLYYRLSTVEIRTPRLAERKEDLPPLERHFISRFASQYEKDLEGLTVRAQMLLARHSWPGNVRELENVLGHAAIMTTSGAMDVTDLPAYLQDAAGRMDDEGAPAPSIPVGPLEEQERLLLISTLEAAAGNRSKAARTLGIGRDALRYKIRKFNLDKTSVAAG